jgi:hypothetical protein
MQKEAKTVSSMSAGIRVMNILGTTIASLQRERGLTAVALSNSTSKAWEDVAKEQSKTDAAIEELFTLQKNIPEKWLPSFKAIKSNTESIRGKKSNTEHSKTMFDDYSQQIAVLLRIDKSLSEGSTTRGVGKVMPSLVALEVARESLAQLRGFTSGLIARNKPFSETNYWQNKGKL